MCGTKGWGVLDKKELSKFLAMERKSEQMEKENRQLNDIFEYFL